MSDHTVSTRHRLLTLCLGSLAAAAIGTSLLGAKGDNPCSLAGPEATLAGPDEPGDRLRVEGLVFAPDGTTPAAGVVVYAYQTDASGRYDGGPGRSLRLRGYMRTDRDGRFAYDTIRPAPYPGGNIAAHVHHQLWGGGYPAQWAADLLFDDDPLVTAEERRRSAALGPFANVRPAENYEHHGRLVVKIRLQLETSGDRFEDSTRHGLAACDQ